MSPHIRKIKLFQFSLDLLDRFCSFKLKGTVEVDETYIGGKRRGGKRGRGADKIIVVSLVEREGSVVSKPFDMLKADDLQDYITERVDKESRIMTDEFRSYRGLDKKFKEHSTVNHGSKEYVRRNSNTSSLPFLEQNRFPSDLRIHGDRIGPMVYRVWTPIGDELYDISGLPVRSGIQN